MDFSINPVAPEDLSALLEMIRELARFEKLEHELQTTHESLRECLFGRQPCAHALFARCGQQPAGYALYFFSFSSFVGRPGIWLDDLYVRPPFRRHGLGRALIHALARVAAQRNCGRFEWAALDWNLNAIDFYRRLGARTLDDWVMLRLDSQGLQKLAGTAAPQMCIDTGPGTG